MRKLILQSGRRSRQAHGELRAFHRLALQRYRATMGFDYLLDEIQAQSRSVNLILDRPAAAKERIEDMGLFLQGDAGPAIGHFELYHLSIAIFHCTSIDSDPVIAFSAVLHGVIDQVFEGVLQSLLVGEHEREAGLDLLLDDEAGVAGADPAGT